MRSKQDPLYEIDPHGVLFTCGLLDDEETHVPSKIPNTGASECLVSGQNNPHL